MTGAEMSWIWIAVIVVCLVVGYLYSQGKIPWLKGVKMPKIFEPKPDTLIEQLKAQTEKELARAEKLRNVLEAKRELAMARAESIKLLREIDGVNPKSVEKEKQDAEREKQKVQEVQNMKPKRL